MIDLPIGGVADTCWLCGRSIPEDPNQQTEMVGLNGVACRDCGMNISHYTPRKWTLVFPGDQSISVYEYVGHRGVPAAEATVGLVFVEARQTPITTRDELAKYYRTLPSRHKRLIWQSSAGIMPEDYRRVVTIESGSRTSEDALDYGDVADYHLDHRAVDDDNQYVTIRKHLPRPYIVGDGGLYADISDDRMETVRRIVTSDTGDQRTFGDAEGRSQSLTDETTSTDGSANQANLSAFGRNAN